MTIFFTSDQHFKHSNVLQFEPSTRKFDSIGEHDDYLIETFNEFVKPEDTVYMLGVFCLAGVTRWIEILGQLNGEIHMIKGNHCIIEKLKEEQRASGEWFKTDVKY